MGPVIEESRIYALQKINQSYKQDRKMFQISRKRKTFQLKKHEKSSQQCIVR